MRNSLLLQCNLYDATKQIIYAINTIEVEFDIREDRYEGCVYLILNKKQHKIPILQYNDLKIYIENLVKIEQLSEEKLMIEKKQISLKRVITLSDYLCRLRPPSGDVVDTREINIEVETNILRIGNDFVDLNLIAGLPLDDQKEFIKNRVKIYLLERRKQILEWVKEYESTLKKEMETPIGSIRLEGNIDTNEFQLKLKGKYDYQRVCVVPRGEIHQLDVYLTRLMWLNYRTDDLVKLILLHHFINMCSVCGKEFKSYSKDGWNYCPHCGVEMNEVIRNWIDKMNKI